MTGAQTLQNADVTQPESVTIQRLRLGAKSAITGSSCNLIKIMTIGNFSLGLVYISTARSKKPGGRVKRGFMYTALKRDESTFFIFILASVRHS